MKDVRDNLQTQTKHLTKYCSPVQDMQTQLEVKDLLESAVIIDETNKGEKKKKDDNVIPAPTKGSIRQLKLKGSLLTKNQLFQSLRPRASNKACTTQPSVEPFTNQLFGTTSSKFSPAHLKEPTPSRDTFKDKEITTEEPKNEMIAYMEEGGSHLKMPKVKSFITPEGTLSQEYLTTQLKEIKRLDDLKVHEKKSEEELKKMLNPITIKAQALKWEEHEEKKAKMLNEFNKCISERTNPLHITKIGYVVNSSKVATMRITRDKDPLNLTKSGKSYDVLLKSLKAKLQWVLTQVKKLGLPPPHELVNFGMTTEDKKRKRTEFLKEVFVTEDIRVDGMNMNLILPLGDKEDLLSAKHQLAVKELSKCETQRATSDKEYAEILRRVRCGNTLTILLLFEEEQAKLKYCSMKKAKNLTSIYGGINIDLSKSLNTSTSWERCEQLAELFSKSLAVSISCPDKFACKLDSLIKFTCSNDIELGLSKLVRSVFPLTKDGQKSGNSVVRTQNLFPSQFYAFKCCYGKIDSSSSGVLIDEYMNLMLWPLFWTCIVEALGVSCNDASSHVLDFPSDMMCHLGKLNDW
nr:hypothetical protein [Tanacetum cinerariifolium]